MVDLVKIRKKSKDAKDAVAEAEAHVPPRPAVPEVEAAPPAEPAPPVEAPPVPEPKKPVATKSAARDAAPPATPPAEPAPGKPSAAVPEPSSPPPAKAARDANVPKPSPPVEEPKPAAPAVEPVPAASLPAPAQADEADADADEDKLERFKRLAGRRRNWAAASRTTEAGSAETEEKAELELLRFRVAGENYAVDIEKIVEIVPPRNATRVPNADDSIVGIISLRGTIVTVIDLRRKLGHPDVDFQKLKDSRMIVVERAGETAGFLVDVVSRVVKLDPSQLESHPVVSSSEQSEYVSGVFQSPDGLVILLDIERILAG